MSEVHNQSVILYEEGSKGLQAYKQALVDAELAAEIHYEKGLYPASYAVYFNPSTKRICRKDIPGAQRHKALTVNNITGAIVFGLKFGWMPTECMNYLYPVNQAYNVFGKGASLVLHSSPLVEWIEYTQEGKLSDGSFKWVATIKKAGVDKTFTMQYSMEDAILAQLMGPMEDGKISSGSSNWRKYPKDMMRWKLVARIISQQFPQALHGADVYEDVKEALSLDPENNLSLPATDQKLTIEIPEVVPEQEPEEASVVMIDPEATEEPVVEETKEEEVEQPEEEIEAKEGKGVEPEEKEEEATDQDIAKRILASEHVNKILFDMEIKLLLDFSEGNGTVEIFNKIKEDAIKRTKAFRQLPKKTKAQFIVWANNNTDFTDELIQFDWFVKLCEKHGYTPGE